jgi:histidine triad (HIT) family protein
VHNNCIFCRIIVGAIVSSKIYEDNEILAFNDINPISPVHIVIIPKKHISGLNVVSREDEKILGHVHGVISKISKQFPEMKNGFRVVSNCGIDAGQTIFHVHYHLLGGRVFSWPPG